MEAYSHCSQSNGRQDEIPKWAEKKDDEDDEQAEYPKGNADV
jgi:hypothetical protein